jgi:type IV secretory pathway TrbL component
MGLIDNIVLIKNIRDDVFRPSNSKFWVNTLAHRLHYIMYDGNKKRTYSKIVDSIIEFILYFAILIIAPVIAVFSIVCMVLLFCSMFIVVVDSSDVIILHLIIIGITGFLSMLLIALYKCTWLNLIQSSIGMKILRSSFAQQEKGFFITYQDESEYVKKIENLLIEWDVYD